MTWTMGIMSIILDHMTVMMMGRIFLLTWRITQKKSNLTKIITIIILIFILQTVIRKKIRRMSNLQIFSL